MIAREGKPAETGRTQNYFIINICRARLIARFRRQFPQVRLNVQVTSREAVLHKLLNQQIACGVMSKQIANPDLEYLDFSTDSVILIVPAGHRPALEYLPG